MIKVTRFECFFPYALSGKKNNTNKIINNKKIIIITNNGKEITRPMAGRRGKVIDRLFSHVKPWPILRSISLNHFVHDNAEWTQCNSTYGSAGTTH